MLSSKNFFSHAFSAAEHSFGVLKKIFSLRRAGMISVAHTRYSSPLMAEVISLMRRSCSRGPSPSKPTSGTPDSSCCSRPATRISKNSSRLLLTIERNLSLSRTGNDGSEHRLSTLLLKASQLSSLLKYLFSQCWADFMSFPSRRRGDFMPASAVIETIPRSISSNLRADCGSFGISRAARGRHFRDLPRAEMRAEMRAETVRFSRGPARSRRLCRLCAPSRRTP